jgi:hypothetical protein
MAWTGRVAGSSRNAPGCFAVLGAETPFPAGVIVARRARSPSTAPMAHRYAAEGLTARRSRSFGCRAVNAIFGISSLYRRLRLDARRYCYDQQCKQ